MKPLPIDHAHLGDSPSAMALAASPSAPPTDLVKAAAPSPRVLMRAVNALVTHEDGVAVHHDEGDIVEVHQDHADELVALGAAVRLQNAPSNG